MKRKNKCRVELSGDKNNMILRLRSSKSHFNTLTKLGIGILILSLGKIAIAEDIDLLDFYEDDETVSISTGTNKPIRLAPSVATVITEEDIEILGARTLDQVLESVPGLHVSRSNDNKLNAIYSIRGVHTTNNSQVLLLIDGSPLRQIFNGGRISRLELPVQNIKRIEVIRGPGSAVFGADAFSGVINVITKGAKELDGLTVGARAGSFDTQDAWLQYGATTANDWQIAASLEHSRSEGDRSKPVTADLQTTLDSIFGSNASNAPNAIDTRYSVVNARIGMRNENWDLSAYYWEQNDAGVGPGVAQALDPTGRVDADILQVQINHHTDISENWNYQSSFVYNRAVEKTKFSIFPPGTVALIGVDGNVFVAPFRGVVAFPDGVLGNPGGTEERINFEVVGFYSGMENHDLRISAGFESQEGDAEETKNFGPGVIDGTEGVVDGTLTDVSDTPAVFTGDLKRDILFFSAQDEWSFADDWALTAGIRFDDYSDFGSTINPRFALVWATTFSLTSKVLYGRAFRAPSAFELFSQNNPTLIGNDQLEPETIDTLELAFDYRFNENYSAKLNLYAYELSDLIVPVEIDSQPGAFRAQNAVDQNGQGFELELSAAVSDAFSIEANYSYQTSENDNSGEDIADAPQQQLFVNAVWEISERTRASGQFNWVAGRERTTADLRDDIDDYQTLDLRFKHSFINGLDASLIARNIANHDVREPSDGTIVEDFAMEGRAVFLELQYNFVH